MKKIIFLIGLVMFPVTSGIASAHYNNYKFGSYVTKPHLHYVFQKIKRTSDVSQFALAKTFAYYEKNRYKKHLSPNYLAIADYTKVAMHKRLYIINLHTGKIYHYLVAHGVNSGKKWGRVWKASNRKGSHMTPPGFFKIGFKEGTTWKKKYKYLFVNGLEWRNRNAKERDILLHTASYVARGGRSFGCFAIEPRVKNQVFSKLKGALLYSYAGKH